MKRSRLSILIPLLLILSSVMSSAILFWEEIRVANISIQHAEIDNLHTTLTQLQNMLNTQLAADNLEDAKLSLSVSGLHPGIRTLLLADENDRVMLANRYIWEGSQAAKVSAYNNLIAQEVRQTEASSVSPNANLLSGYYPVTLKLAAGGVGGNRIGALFVEYDLAPQMAQARHDAVVQASLFGGLMIAVAIAVAILLHWLVARRMKKIVEASKRFAAGDLDARVHLHGHDELAELGHAFDYMAGQRKEAQEALRQANVYNRSLIEASLDPLVTISAEGKITDVNRATEAVTGRSRSELIRTDFSDYFTEPDKARAGYQQVFLKGSVTDYPLALRHRDGHVTDVLYNASVYRDEAGEVLGVFAAARDVTEHKRAEAIRTQLAAIVEFSNDAIIGKTIDGIITNWNKSAEAIYGYTADEVIGKSITMLAPPSRHAEIHEILERVSKGGMVANHESERLRKDGSLIQVALTLSPIKDASGAITGISTIARDITEHKRAEFILRQSEEALKEAQRIAHVGSWHMDLATNEVVWSQVLYEMYGFDPALPPPLYTESMKLFTPESWERLSTSIAKCTETGIPYELELEMIPKEGGRKWMLARGELVRDTHGAPVRVRGVVMDITVRKQAEEKLRRSEHGLSEAQRIAHLGNWELDLVTNVLTWSDEIYRIFEIDKDKFGASYDAFLNAIHPDDREMVNKAYSDSVANKVPYDIVHRLQMQDGRIKYVNEKCETYYAEDGKPLRSVGTVHDITERKKVEMELRELNNDFVTLLENSGDFIYFKDKDSRIRFCSQTMANITGHHSWRDMIGKHDLEIFPEDTARVYYEEELPIFREGKPLLNKTDPYYDDQGKQGWVNTNKWPVFGDDKKTVVGIFGISRDITELKEAEDKINELNHYLEARVTERTAQLEAANQELEAFSYSVSHDLRTPLRAIDGFSRILLDDYIDKLDDEGKRLLNVVRDNTSRMGQLIDDILKFSRTGRVEMTFSEIDMEKQAREVFAELQPAVAEGQLQLEIEHLPSARGDSAMMHQVFVNLLSNAIKFSRNSVPAKIKVGGSIEGDEAVYYVRDNGAGFDMHYAGKLFGVFQRLHSMEEFEGTGIGLAIVKRIITRHGGRVWAEGKVNEGATIYFALPIKEAAHG